MCESVERAKANGYAGYGQLWNTEQLLEIKQIREQNSKIPCYICNQPNNGGIGMYTKQHRGEWICKHCYENVLDMRPVGDPTVNHKNYADKYRQAFTPDQSGYYYLDNGMYHGLALVDVENKTVLLKGETEVFSLDDEIIRDCFYGARYDNLPDAVPLLDSGRLIGFPKLVS